MKKLIIASAMVLMAGSAKAYEPGGPVGQSGIFYHDNPYNSVGEGYNGGLTEGAANDHEMHTHFDGETGQLIDEDNGMIIDWDISYKHGTQPQESMPDWYANENGYSYDADTIPDWTDGEAVMPDGSSGSPYGDYEAHMYNTGAEGYSEGNNDLAEAYATDNLIGSSYNGIGLNHDNPGGNQEDYCDSTCGSQASQNNGEKNESTTTADGNNVAEAGTHYDGETGQIVNEHSNGNSYQLTW